MAQAAIALGSNLGDRGAHLDAAVAALSALPGTRILRQSPRYDTDPVDVPEEFRDRRFLNGALLVETDLTPEALLRSLLDIESSLRRVRTVRNGPRTVDLDLIAYQGETRGTPDLTLPHPRAKAREFVLRPLRDMGVDIDSLTAGAPV